MLDFELDHVFICAPSGRSDVEAFASFGLVPLEGIHPGQGTANACFFFENAYLEILWRHDDRELTSAAVQPTGLWERVRWKETGACPFGIAVRPKSKIWPPLASPPKQAQRSTV